MHNHVVQPMAYDAALSTRQDTSLGTRNNITVIAEHRTCYNYFAYGQGHLHSDDNTPINEQWQIYGGVIYTPTVF